MILKRNLIEVELHIHFSIIDLEETLIEILYKNQFPQWFWNDISET